MSYTPFTKMRADLAAKPGTHTPTHVRRTKKTSRHTKQLAAFVKRNK